MNVGDFFGSGTISGTEDDAKGCLLEWTENGKRSLKLQGGDERTFLLDGDEVTLKGCCGNEDGALVGFGECSGRIEAALDLKF